MPSISVTHKLPCKSGNPAHAYAFFCGFQCYLLWSFNYKSIYMKVFEVPCVILWLALEGIFSWLHVNFEMMLLSVFIFFHEISYVRSLEYVCKCRTLLELLFLCILIFWAAFCLGFRTTNSARECQIWCLLTAKIKQELKLDQIPSFLILLLDVGRVHKARCGPKVEIPI